MADHHDAQDYTANGPTGIGFRTGGDNPGIANGVVATGTEIGVHGIGAGIEGSNFISTGVVGESSKGLGVRGSSLNDDGVFGQSDNGRGVHGSGPTGVYGEGPTGVHGEGDLVGVDGESKNGTGVFGDSDSGVGVRGSSKTGEGGQFVSGTGAGLRGSSTEDRGGVFRSENVAQIRLVPIRQDTTFPILPKRGKVGDLIWLFVIFGESHLAGLYLTNFVVRNPCSELSFSESISSKMVNFYPDARAYGLVEAWMASSLNHCHQKRR